MGKFRLFSYNPPKKGVSKNDERASAQTDFVGFFRMYGRKFWNISNLNLLMAAFVIVLAAGVWYLSPYPVAFWIFIGVMIPLFGLFSVGTTYITRGYVRGDPVYILSDFKYAVKNNWKQGIVLGIIDVLVVFLLVYDVSFWIGPIDFTKYFAVEKVSVSSEVQSDEDINDGSNLELDIENNNVSDIKDNTVAEVLYEDTSVSEKSDTAEQNSTESEEEPAEKQQSFFASVSLYACIFLFFIYMMMRNYIYILAVTFKLSLFKIIKNSFIFAFLGIKRNALAFLGICLVLYINIFVFFVFNILGVMLPLIITLATCSFIGAYAAYPVIKKYMITPYYDDEEVNESYDRIFIDRE